MGLLEAAFTMEEIGEANKQGAIVQGTVNGLHVLWNQRINKLIVKDRSKLERNIVFTDGIPCVYIEVMENDVPRYIKMVLHDYI